MSKNMFLKIGEKVMSHKNEKFLYEVSAVSDDGTKVDVKVSNRGYKDVVHEKVSADTLYRVTDEELCCSECGATLNENDDGYCTTWGTCSDCI